MALAKLSKFVAAAVVVVVVVVVIIIIVIDFSALPVVQTGNVAGWGLSRAVWL